MFLKNTHTLDNKQTSLNLFYMNGAKYLWKFRLVISSGLVSNILHTIKFTHKILISPTHTCFCNFLSKIIKKTDLLKTKKAWNFLPMNWFMHWKILLKTYEWPNNGAFNFHLVALDFWTHALWCKSGSKASHTIEARFFW